MPLSGSTDIPHVTVHDHYIRKPVTQKEKDKIKTFLGLFSINEKDPDAWTRAKAYVDQYDKFEQNTAYLDSALALLKDVDPRRSIRLLLQIHFIHQDFKQMISLANAFGEQRCDSLFSKQSYDNKDAWASYRLAEAYAGTGDKQTALKWFKKAVTLAPYNLDFRNKLGSGYVGANDLAAATGEFEFIMKENPKFVSVYSNLGYIKLMQGFPAEALRLYTIGRKLDPDNEALLLNLAGYYVFANDKLMARKYLEMVLKKHPGNQKATMVLQQLSKR
jgi:tetratricopeptide (TPR) repeat protein